MKEKLEYLMNQTGLRVGQIAEMLGVKAPVISHLLVGRNMPNFKLTAKIIEVFSDYSPLWWLGLSDDPHATFTTVGKSPSSESQESNHSNLTPSTSTSEPTLFEEVDEPTDQASIVPSRSTSEIERVIVFYRDKSFESFTPKKR